MTTTEFDERERVALEKLQVTKLNRGLSLLRLRNGFYQAKLANVSLPLSSLRELERVPFTEKRELLEDQRENPPLGTNLTSPRWRYTRIHATSGTTGDRLKWLDTGRSWAWWLHCWREIYRAAGVGRRDIVFAAFGFGPFIGFWAGFEAAQSMGAMAVAGGAQTSLQRIDWIRDSQATVLLSTPTYALRLAEVAHENDLELTSTSVRVTIHAGEPGASIPSTRERIEKAWGARAFDHAGMTEVGAWGFQCNERVGLHLLETDFIGEVLDPSTGEPVAPGSAGELVLTNLGRWDMPAVRYRTGDLVVRGSGPCGCGSPYVWFPGGILGRTDDMVQVRGVNVYPTAVEALIREQASVTEFDVEIFPRKALWEMRVRVEVDPPTDTEEVCSHLVRELRTRIGLRAEVESVPPGTLPRYELKAKRFRVQRDDSHERKRPFPR